MWRDLYLRGPTRGLRFGPESESSKVFPAMDTEAEFKVFDHGLREIALLWRGEAPEPCFERDGRNGVGAEFSFCLCHELAEGYLVLDGAVPCYSLDVLIDGPVGLLRRQRWEPEGQQFAPTDLDRVLSLCWLGCVCPAAEDFAVDCVCEQVGGERTE